MAEYVTGSSDWGPSVINPYEKDVNGNYKYPGMLGVMDNPSTADLTDWFMSNYLGYGGDATQGGVSAIDTSISDKVNLPTTGDVTNIAGGIDKGLLDDKTALPGQVSLGSSTYGQSLQDLLLNPSYDPTSSSEQAFLNSIMAQTGGANASRGLSSPTTEALAVDLAPTMLDLRKNRVNELLGGYSAENERQLGEAGLGASQRKTDIETNASYDNSIREALLTNAGLSTTADKAKAENLLNLGKTEADVAQADVSNSLKQEELNQAFRDQDISAILQILGASLPRLISGESGSMDETVVGI